MAMSATAGPSMRVATSCQPTAARAVVAGGVEPVAGLGGQVDPADERDPVVDHDRLLVVAMEWALVAVECDLHLRVAREAVPHERDVFPRGSEQWERRAGPGEHADVDALRELREEVAQDDVLSVPDERERGREVPAGKVDVRVGAEKFLGHRRQRFGAVDQDVDRIAGARRRIRLGPAARRRRKRSLPPDPAEPSPVVRADLRADPGSEPRLHWPGQSAQPASVLLKVRDWFGHEGVAGLRPRESRGGRRVTRMAVACRRSRPPVAARHALGHLGRDAEAEHAAAESDPAEHEPGPAERKPSDHIAEPVEVEQAPGSPPPPRRSRRRLQPEERGRRVGGAVRAAALQPPRKQRRSSYGRSGTTVRALPRPG